MGFGAYQRQTLAHFWRSSNTSIIDLACFFGDLRYEPISPSRSGLEYARRKLVSVEDHVMVALKSCSRRLPPDSLRTFTALAVQLPTHRSPFPNGGQLITDES
jgi:hypothetical protein